MDPREIARPVAIVVCPFCECDPFHYEHNGLGYEAVAVNCCDRGNELFQYHNPRMMVLADRISRLRLRTKARAKHLRRHPLPLS